MFSSINYYLTASTFSSTNYYLPEGLNGGELGARIEAALVQQERRRRLRAEGGAGVDIERLDRQVERASLEDLAVACVAQQQLVKKKYKLKSKNKNKLKQKK